MLNVVAPNDDCNKLFCEYKPKFMILNLKELYSPAHISVVKANIIQRFDQNPENFSFLVLSFISKSTIILSSVKCFRFQFLYV
jgi:hypothetical protein